MRSAGDADGDLHTAHQHHSETEKLTNPATQRCVIAAAEGWVGASRARSPCSNTRIIYLGSNTGIICRGYEPYCTCDEAHEQ